MSVRLNGDQFAAELKRETDKLVEEHFKLLGEVCVSAADTMERTAPVQTGRLVKSIAASLDRQDKRARGGSAQVRGVFSGKRKRIPRKAFLMVNDPKASLLENGTVKMAARPFFEAALRAQENKTR